MSLLVVVGGDQVDLLQAAPLVHAVHVAQPELEVTVAAAPQALAALAPGLPGSAELLPLATTGSGGSLRDWGRAWLAFRRRRIDVAVVCSTHLRLRLLTYLACIPRRLGEAGGPGTRLLSETIRHRQREPASTTWLRLATLLGVRPVAQPPWLAVPAAAQRAADDRFIDCRVDDRRMVVAIAPGNGFADQASSVHDGRTWEPERYAHLGNQLGERHGATIVLLGTARDQAVVHATAVHLGVTAVNLCGTFTPLEAAAFLSRCDLLIGGDTPLLHLAASVGTASVGLFGPTDAHRRGPHGRNQRTIQSLEGSGTRSPAPSVDAIRVDDVLASIEST